MTDRISKNRLSENAEVESRLRSERDQLALTLTTEKPGSDSIREGLRTGDAGSELEIWEVEYSHLSAIRLRMRELEDALQRLSDGHYGECAECGKAIARKRLSSDPAALLCASCQAAHEDGLRPATL
jgi:DnaK suppressor protein